QIDGGIGQKLGADLHQRRELVRVEGALPKRRIVVRHRTGLSGERAARRVSRRLRQDQRLTGRGRDDLRAGLTDTAVLDQVLVQGATERRRDGVPAGGRRARGEVTDLPQTV